MPGSKHNVRKSTSLSGSLEDYLETIYRLGQEKPFARVRDIAKARGVKAGSVSPALKRLADLGLVNYVRREYVSLTTDGAMEARRVFSRHQILTRFFHEVLRMPDPAAEEQACEMEHSLTNDAMDRLVKFFEFLTVCPARPPNFFTMFNECSMLDDGWAVGDGACEGGACGLDIIDLRDTQQSKISLHDLEPGQSGRVTQVSASGAIRQRLLDMGILPQAVIEVERIAPSGDPIWIKLLGSQLALRRNEAEGVRVIKV